MVDHDGRLLGMLKFGKAVKAAQAGKGGQRVSAWMQRCGEGVVPVPPHTPLADLEAIMIEGSIGASVIKYKV